MVKVRTELRDMGVESRFIGWTHYTEKEFFWISENGFYQLSFYFYSDKTPKVGKKLPANFTVV